MKRRILNLRVNSIRLYYLNGESMINGKREEKYGIGVDDVIEYKYNGDSQKFKRWAIRKLKVDKKRDFKFEIRTTKGRFLFDK